MPCDFTVKILHKHLKEQSNAKKIKYLRHLGDGAWIWLRRPLARVLQGFQQVSQSLKISLVLHCQLASGNFYLKIQL